MSADELTGAEIADRLEQMAAELDCDAPARVDALMVAAHRLRQPAPRSWRSTFVAWCRATRDMRMTWPHATVKIQLAPWHWRLIPLVDAYSEPREDDRAGYVSTSAHWLMLECNLSWNMPPFGVLPIADVYREPIQ